jgi:hypothetical protein
MFCANCGKEVQETSIFCPHCGIKVGEERQISVETVHYDTPPTPQSTVLAEPAQKIPQMGDLKVVRILSIISFVVFGFGVINYIMAQYPTDALAVITIILISYAFAHAIVALVQGHKYGRKAMKIMAIIGIVLYVLMLTALWEPDDMDTYRGGGFIMSGYALAFAIVAFVQSKRKTA